MKLTEFIPDMIDYIRQLMLVCSDIEVSIIESVGKPGGETLFQKIGNFYEFTESRIS